MSLEFTTPDGTVTLTDVAYRVVSDPVRMFARAETNTVGKTIVFGDRGREPVPLELELDIQEATFAATITRADGIVADAETATVVTTYRGARSVHKLLRDTIRGEGYSVRLRLAFAPAGGSYS